MILGQLTMGAHQMKNAPLPGGTDGTGGLGGPSG